MICAVDDSSALGTNAACQFVEDVIGIFFLWRNGACRVLCGDRVMIVHCWLRLFRSSTETRDCELFSLMFPKEIAPMTSP